MAEQLVQGVLLEDDLSLKNEKQSKAGELLVNSIFIGIGLAALTYFGAKYSYDALKDVDFSQLQNMDVMNAVPASLYVVLVLLFGFIEAIHIIEIKRLKKEIKAIEQFQAARPD